MSDIWDTDISQQSPYIFTLKCTVTEWRGTVFVHRFQLMTLGTCQAVKLEAPKWARGECTEVGNHRPYIYHCQLFHSATYETGGGYCTRSDEFCKYPLLEKSELS